MAFVSSNEATGYQSANADNSTRLMVGDKVGSATNEAPVVTDDDEENSSSESSSSSTEGADMLISCSSQVPGSQPMATVNKFEESASSDDEDEDDDDEEEEEDESSDDESSGDEDDSSSDEEDDEEKNATGFGPPAPTRHPTRIRVQRTPTPRPDGPPTRVQYKKPAVKAANLPYNPETDPQLEAKIMILEMLTHGVNCRARGRCRFPNCTQAKAMIRHVSKCTTSNCSMSYCSKSKFVLQHGPQIQAVLQKRERATKASTTTTATTTTNNAALPPVRTPGRTRATPKRHSSKKMKIPRWVPGKLANIPECDNEDGSDEEEEEAMRKNSLLLQDAVDNVLSSDSDSDDSDSDESDSESDADSDSELESESDVESVSSDGSGSEDDHVVDDDAIATGPTADVQLEACFECVGKGSKMGVAARELRGATPGHEDSDNKNGGENIPLQGLGQTVQTANITKPQITGKRTNSCSCTDTDSSSSSSGTDGYITAGSMHASDDDSEFLDCNSSHSMASEQEGSGHSTETAKQQEQSADMQMRANKGSSEGTVDNTPAKQVQTTSVYENVRCLKRKGSLVLSSEELRFEAENDDEHLAISWSHVSKHQLTAPPHIMLRVLLSTGESHTFKLQDRKALARLRSDVKKWVTSQTSPLDNEASMVEVDGLSIAFYNNSQRWLMNQAQNNGSCVSIPNTTAMLPPTVYNKIYFKSREGTLSLHEKRILFETVRSDNGEKPLQRSLPYDCISKALVTPDSYPETLLKLITSEGLAVVFDIQDRDLMKKIQKEIYSRILVATARKNAKPGNDRSSVSRWTLHVYEPIVFQKTIGAIKLSQHGLTFVPSSGSVESFGIMWDKIARHKASPPGFAKALLRISLTSGINLIFELSNDDELSRLRYDMETLLQRNAGRTQEKDFAAKVKSTGCLLGLNNTAKSYPTHQRPRRRGTNKDRIQKRDGLANGECAIVRTTTK